ncbi:hypothetical protein [Lachnoclostridium sp.]|uniref:hypothetical protein n=1 Tax=Lachnoclostridium sp. TaxID=2028282 RepID=UPI0026C8EC8E|nr:hypothetical protein [Lachnoclostridium sp.]
MKAIKNMLLGIAIILAVIIFHLFIEAGLWTDFIAVIGIILVLAGYNSKDE